MDFNIFMSDDGAIKVRQFPSKKIKKEAHREPP